MAVEKSRGASAIKPSLDPSAANEFQARGQLRRKMRRRRQARRIAIALAALAVLATLTWLLFGSAVFAIKEVRVEGQQILTADQIVQHAQVPMGAPLARAPLKAVAGRVEQLPAVADAKATRKWPNTVHIQVVERAVRFQIQDAGGFHWVDDEGRVFNVSPDAQPVPLVSADQADDKTLRGVAALLNALPAEVQAQIASVDATKTNRITVNLSDGRQVVWGNVNAPAEKATVLVAILNQPGQVYDVSVPSHPAIS